MSTRAVYLYWLSNGIWMGANYILLTGLINSGLMGGRMTLAVQLPLVIALIWATFKILIMLTVGFGGIWYASQHGIANEFNLETLTPSASSGIGFFSAIIYNVTGFELVACMARCSGIRPRRCRRRFCFRASRGGAAYTADARGTIAQAIAIKDSLIAATGAAHITLNAIEHMRNAFPPKDIRPSMAHDDLMEPGQYHRFHNHLEKHGKFFEAGARVAYGSDWPIDPLNEWYNLQCGLTRRINAEHPRLDSDRDLTLTKSFAPSSPAKPSGKRSTTLPSSLQMCIPIANLGQRPRYWGTINI